MNFPGAQTFLSNYLDGLVFLIDHIPGSALVSRYIESSYQDDPIRSVIELFMFLFAVLYLFAARQSTKPIVVHLSEEEIDDLVDEWIPEPLVDNLTRLEKMEVDKRPVILG